MHVKLSIKHLKEKEGEKTPTTVWVRTHDLLDQSFVLYRYN